ncbi:hypothetical protein GSI_01206 [Ganoderma sinense ZZ0214-1]|uniref:DUF6533 domain-containing protein n=1 Tax=Ganoderma sinense ZZ0214-1 TaxID=1077348 RepID=A0A2G8SUV8_9APHY|nr:hypothetical protein GSI_01206 [Ganoderma sinense ZZ0214-1]
MQLAARDLSTLDAQYYHDLFFARAVTLAGYAILVAEAFEALPDEARHIWPARWSTVKVLYVINRYGNLVLLGASTLQTLGIWRSTAHDFCYNSTLALSLIQFTSYASVHVLVLLRAWATWGRHVKILLVLAALFVVYAVASIAILTWGIVSVGSFSWILWIPSLILECAIFVLTMVSIRKFDFHLHLACQLPIVRVIIRDAILYFILTLFSSLFNIFVWVFYGDRPLNLLGTSFTLCLMIPAGQRLVLDLRKVSSNDSLSTTRVGREVDRAIEAMAPSRTPSPIVFAERSLASNDPLIPLAQVKAHGVAEIAEVSAANV